MNAARIAVRHRGVWFAFTCTCRVPQIETSQSVPCCAQCWKPLVNRLPTFMKKRRAA